MTLTTQPISHTDATQLSATSQDFIAFAIAQGVLKFGEFTTKAGRLSPYFFNAGLFNDGASVLQLSKFYARTLLQARKNGLEFDMLFGPAYKGITLAAGIAMQLAEMGHNVPFAYNRKEAKDHGEGGTIVGAPLHGRVVIVDDVISAGTSVRQSVELIRHAGATPAAVLIALDRQERTSSITNNPTDSATDNHQVGRSAAQEVAQTHNLSVISIANLDDLLRFLQQPDQRNHELARYQDQVAAYRHTYGVSS
jgi:orotate phosphoribosyltransferase